MSCSTDRWSCPACGHVETLQLVTTWERAKARLRRVRDDHGLVHARGARTQDQAPRDSVTGDAQ